jgi:F420-non-reducing hydrogenase iron-sulfur subunit
MNKIFLPKITVFHCINTFGKADDLMLMAKDSFELKNVQLPCSAMVKDIFLLRAFEAGSDGVAVFVCPEGTCRYIEGNLRAKKRVAWVQKLLDEIGLGAERLSLYNINHGDTMTAAQIIKTKAHRLKILGPNPAA